MADLPEQQARQTIDAMQAAAGWAVQDYKAFDPSASLGIALREVPLKSGRCDYLLLVNRKPEGVVEAKKEGTTLSIVADQSAHYAANLPDFLAAGLGSDSLPFRYESTGVETFFRDERDSFLFAEQTRIVAEVERRLSMVEELEAVPPPQRAPACCMSFSRKHSPENSSHEDQYNSHPKLQKL